MCAAIHAAEAALPEYYQHDHHGLSRLVAHASSSQQE